MADDRAEQAQRPKKVKRRRRAARNQIHIYPHPSGIWYMRGTVADKRIHESTKTHSKEHAEHIAAARTKELLDEKVHGKSVVSTFAEAVASYKSSRGTLGETSMSRWIDKLEAHFGKIKLKDIDGTLVRQYAIDTYPDAKNSSRNTMVLGPMSLIMGYAAEAKLCAAVKISRFPDDSSKVHGHDDAFVNKFLDGCHDPELRAMVALCTTTGVRCIEARRVEWTQIDRGAMEIVLRPDQTKTGVGRSLALTGAVLQYLDEIPKSGSRVFRWVSTPAVNQVIYHCCKKLGLEHTSIHRLGRHSFAERMLRLGHSCHEVAEMGGWESLAVFVSRYGHLEKKKVAADVRRAAGDLLKPKLKVVG